MDSKKDRRIFIAFVFLSSFFFTRYEKNPDLIVKFYNFQL